MSMFKECEDEPIESVHHHDHNVDCAAVDGTCQLCGVVMVTDQNEAKLKCLRWIEAMTMVCPELFSQELGEYWGWPEDDGNNDEGANFIARWACFSGDSMGFSQEFRGRGWAGLLAAMEDCEDAEGPSYSIDWDERKGMTIDDLLSVEVY